MDNNQKSPEQNQGDAKRNTPSQENAGKTQPVRTEAEIEEAGKGGKEEHHRKITAAEVNSIISSPTQSVRGRHINNDDLASTGTNVSYEGPTSTAAGGTGFNSGQAATGEKLFAGSEYDAGGAERENEDTGEEKDII